MSTIMSIHTYCESYRFSYHYRPQRKLRQGYVFTPVCLPFCSQGAGMHGGPCSGGGHMRGRGDVHDICGHALWRKRGGWGGSVCMVGETAIAAGEYASY